MKLQKEKQLTTNSTNKKNDKTNLLSDKNREIILSQTTHPSLNNHSFEEPASNSTWPLASSVAGPRGQLTLSYSLIL